MEFKKYVAAGNDFIAFKGEDIKGIDKNNLALSVCNRHFGLGADGILIAEESDIGDIQMLYYNSDGSQGEMCGNGIRAFSKFIYEEDIIKKEEIKIETLAGIKNVKLSINEDIVEKVKVNMGRPIYSGKKIPVDIDKDRIEGEEITIDGKSYEFSAVLVGVPHVVIFVDDIKNIDINDLGSKIETHDLFPKKTNVNFVEVISKEKINIYTWERGAGRTLGCGTGSSSSVLIGNNLGLLNKKVEVETEGGSLVIELVNEEIFMTGTATLIAEGEYFYRR